MGHNKDQLTLNHEAGVRHEAASVKLADLHIRLYEVSNRNKALMRAYSESTTKWINWAESEAALAGAFYTNGSIRPMIEHNRATELINDRIMLVEKLLKLAK